MALAVGTGRERREHIKRGGEGIRGRMKEASGSCRGHMDTRLAESEGVQIDDVATIGLGSERVVWGIFRN